MDKENSIKLREATLKDAAFVVPLFIAAYGEIANYLTALDRAELVEQRMYHYYQQESLAPFKEITILEFNGKPAAIMSVMGGDEFQKVSEKMAKELMRIDSREEAKQRAKEIREAKSVKEDEYYLDALAVAVEYRGQHLPDFLMQELDRRAQALGFKQAVLYAAKNLVPYYLKQGWSEGEERFTHYHTLCKHYTSPVREGLTFDI